MKFKNYSMSKPTLHRYADATEIRDATADELRESVSAAESDGGAGVILVDGIACYVME